MKIKTAVTQRSKVRSNSLTPYSHEKWHGTLADNPQFGPAPVWNVPPPSQALLPAFMPQTELVQVAYDPRSERVSCDRPSQPGAYNSQSELVARDPKSQPSACYDSQELVSIDFRSDRVSFDPQSRPRSSNSQGERVPYDRRSERVSFDFDRQSRPGSSNSQGELVPYDRRSERVSRDPKSQPRVFYDSQELVPFDLQNERVSFDRQSQAGSSNSQSELVPYNPQNERVAYDPQSKVVPHDPENQRVAYDPPPPVPNATRLPPPQFLYHYTDHTGMSSIVEERYIRKSCPAQTNRGGWYGEGVYLTAVPPTAPDNVILINNWNDDGLNTSNSAWNGSKAARLQYCFVISSMKLTSSALEKIWDNKGRNIWVYRSGIPLKDKVVALRRRW